MKDEKNSLYDMFFTTLRPLYSKEMAGRLAEAHCEAHKQFLREMYLDAARQPQKLRGGKVTEQQNRNRSALVKAARKLIGKSKVIVSRAKPANLEDVKREIVSYLSSMAEPISLSIIHNQVAGQFGWSFSQVKRAVRELREAGGVEQIGAKKLAKYRVVTAAAAEVVGQ